MPARPGDLSVRVETGDGRSGCMLGDPADLAADAAFTQDAAPGDAVEREQAEGAAAVERAQRVRAGLIGRFENGVVVPLHDPGHAALGNLSDAAERPVLEVRIGDVTNVLLLAATNESEWTRHRERVKAALSKAASAGAFRRER